ncbi:MAG: CDGSH iron-sulfur domain-containing protein [Gammaproteobacteria bacterium]
MTDHDRTLPSCRQNGPYGIELEPGKYFWCSCGRSTKQPFCDGSHHGTPFNPVVVDIEHRQAVWLCGCKRTANAPHCDGAHQASG